MIRLQNLSKQYQTKQLILNQINLELKKGDFLYVLGGTGAGKSTLLKMLASEENPSAGEIHLFGYSLETASPSTLQAIRQSIAYIPQSIQLISDFTVFENIALGISYGGARVLRAEVRTRIYELLEKLSLTHLRDVQAKKLSGGEAQRVAIARALARKPELIIADEPTGAQDHQNTWSVMDLIQRANLSGAAVVLATHDREIVRRVRKKCAILHHGKITIDEALCTL
jgi:cell division transport system ATP-binding protein